MRMLSPISGEWSWPRRSMSSDLMEDAYDDFERIADAFLRPTYTHTVGFQPSCDISETESHYMVSFDMPGVKKENIKVEVQGNKLVVSGERQREAAVQDGEATLRTERVYGKFERSFLLPNSANAEKIEAHFENGILNVALPKAETAKSKSVKIQTGNSSFLNKLMGSKNEGTKELKDVKVF
jgi:HSP20 family protein